MTLLLSCCASLKAIYWLSSNFPLIQDNQVFLATQDLRKLSQQVDISYAFIWGQNPYSLHRIFETRNLAQTHISSLILHKMRNSSRARIMKRQYQAHLLLQCYINSALLFLTCDLSNESIFRCGGISSTDLFPHFISSFYLCWLHLHLQCHVF